MSSELFSPSNYYGGLTLAQPATNIMLNQSHQTGLIEQKDTYINIDKNWDMFGECNKLKDWAGALWSGKWSVVLSIILDLNKKRDDTHP